MFFIDTHYMLASNIHFDVKKDIYFKIVSLSKYLFETRTSVLHKTKVFVYVNALRNNKILAKIY